MQHLACESVSGVSVTRFIWTVIRHFGYLCIPITVCLCYQAESLLFSLEQAAALLGHILLCTSLSLSCVPGRRHTGPRMCDQTQAAWLPSTDTFDEISTFLFCVLCDWRDLDPRYSGRWLWYNPECTSPPPLLPFCSSHRSLTCLRESTCLLSHKHWQHVRYNKTPVTSFSSQSLCMQNRILGKI